MVGRTYILVVRCSLAVDPPKRVGSNRGQKKGREDEKMVMLSLYCYDNCRDPHLSFLQISSKFFLLCQFVI